MEVPKELISILKKGKVAVMPTDTIYGLCGLALKRKTVERIYEIKKRTPEKPFIILIASYADLGKFGVTINAYQKKFLAKYWPGPVSIALACPGKKFQYLHRGTGFLGFRLPDNAFLRGIIEETGPLVAPSANPEGFKPSSNTKMAKKYFGNEVNYYLDWGAVESEPSTLVLLNEDKFAVLRTGGTKIK